MDRFEAIHNCMGGLEPESILCPRKDGAWYIDSVTDELDRAKYVWSSLETARAELTEAGFDVSLDVVNYAGDYRVTHLATAALLEARKAKSDSKFAGAERGYVRFGACPKSGKSRNARGNCDESGVSVFEAEFAGNAFRVLADSTLEATLNLVRDRPAYRVYGECVGTGADGEPVIKVSKSIKL